MMMVSDSEIAPYVNSWYWDGLEPGQEEALVGADTQPVVAQTFIDGIRVDWAERRLGYDTPSRYSYSTWLEPGRLFNPSSYPIGAHVIFHTETLIFNRGATLEVGTQSPDEAAPVVIPPLPETRPQAQTEARMLKSLVARYTRCWHVGTVLLRSGDTRLLSQPVLPMDHTRELTQVLNRYPELPKAFTVGTVYGPTVPDIAATVYGRVNRLAVIDPQTNEGRRSGRRIRAGQPSQRTVHRPTVAST